MPLSPEEQNKVYSTLNWMSTVFCVVIFVCVAVANEWFFSWPPSEGLVRGLVYGVMLGVGVGVIAILKMLWRKLVHKSPVQRL